MMETRPPSVGYADTSPINGGGRKSDHSFVFPHSWGKWLSVRETDGGVRADTKTSRKHAKRLRREMTNAEVKLWVHLRGRDLAGHRFRRQHPVGPYIVDFACVNLPLIVEVDGETHGSKPQKEHDARRTRYLEKRGWVVLRVFNVDVYNNLDGVLEALSERCHELNQELNSPPPFMGEVSAQRTEGEPLEEMPPFDPAYSRPTSPINRGRNQSDIVDKNTSLPTERTDND
jgi:very-short-patch-repair endonuclease